MALFDPNTIAIIGDTIVEDVVVKQPDETGQAMAAHNLLNSSSSSDYKPKLGLDNNQNPEDLDEAIGTDEIFKFGDSSISEEELAIRVKKFDEEEMVRQANLNSFFTSLEHLIQVEDNVNPILTDHAHNPQMTVVPLPDPTVPKTADDILDINGQKIDNTIDQDDNLVMWSMEYINLARRISQENLNPYPSDGKFTYKEILEDIDYTNVLANTVSETKSKILELKSNIKEQGGIDKSMVLALESAQPGLLTSRVSLESFTSYPSKTNLTISLEGVADWYAGANIVGGIAAFAVIVKIILWIREKLSGSIKVSNKDIEHTHEAKEAIDNTIQAIAKEKVDILRTDPQIMKRLNDACTRLNDNKKYTAKPDNILEAHIFITQQFVNRDFAKFNGLHSIIVTNKQITPALKKLTDFLIHKTEELSKKFEELKVIAKTTDKVDPNTFKGDWKPAYEGSKLLGFTQLPDDISKLGTHLNQTLADRVKKKIATPSYSTIAGHSYDPSSTEGLDHANASINKLLKDVQAAADVYKSIGDKDLADSRVECANILKGELTNLAAVSSEVIVIRNHAGQIVKLLHKVVSQTNGIWKGVFKGTEIQYKPSK